MNMENPQNKYRYERKYKLDISQYEILLHSMFFEGMKVHHPTRFINNIYFDTLNFESYYENVEGESERNKYRLRWYGDRFNRISPVFEVKIKKDQVNKKRSLKLPEVDFRSFEDVEIIYDHVLESMEEEDSTLLFHLMNKIPTLLNGYKRDYFLSADGNTRLTIDRDMFFYNCRNSQEHLLNDVMVVEVKYASGVTPNINFDKYELILGKNSKYVSGLEYTALK